MARVATKTKILQPTIQNKDVIELFNGVLSSNSGTPLRVAFPKFRRVEHHTMRFVRVLEALAESSALKPFAGERGALEEHVRALRSDAKAAFDTPDLVAFTAEKDKKIPLEALDALSYDQVPEEARAKFSAVYESLMRTKVVGDALETCRKLAPHKKRLAALDVTFIVKRAGMTFAPLGGLATFNLKQVLISDQLDAAGQKYIAEALKKLYEVAHEVYEAVSAPDFSVDEFVETVRSQIGELKKVIPRCDDAISRIVDSVDLLKTNFGSYYREQVSTGADFAIMENFIRDVAKNTSEGKGKGGGGSGARVKAQFAKIIGYYKKVASQKTTDPKLAALFGQVDTQFAKLGAAEKEGDEAQDDDAEASADASVDATPKPESKSLPVETKAPAPTLSHAEKQKQKKNKKKNASRRKKTAPNAATPAPGSTTTPPST